MGWLWLCDLRSCCSGVWVSLSQHSRCTAGDLHPGVALSPETRHRCPGTCGTGETPVGWVCDTGAAHEGDAELAPGVPPHPLPHPYLTFTFTGAGSGGSTISATKLLQSQLNPIKTQSVSKVLRQSKGAGGGWCLVGVLRDSPCQAQTIRVSSREKSSSSSATAVPPMELNGSRTWERQQM